MVKSRHIGLVIVAALCSLVVASQTQAAVTRRVPFFGLWQGGAYNDDNSRKFSHCAAWASYRSGITMLVAVDRQYGWRIGFTNPAWNLTLGRDIPLTISFDGAAPWAGVANVIDRQTAKVEMQTSSALINSFRQAYGMTIEAEGQTFRFALDGTSRLMVDLARCVTNSLAIERGELPQTFVESTPTQPPAKPAAPTTAVTPNPAPANTQAARLEFQIAATRIASNLLLQAKIPNARLLSTTEVPAGLQGRGAVWTSDVGMGTVDVLPASVGKDVQQTASYILLDDAGSCKGDFASSRASELVDNRVLVKATSMCTDSSGPRTFRYFIMQIDQATFAVYSLAGNGASFSTQSGMQEADFQAAAVRATFSTK